MLKDAAAKTAILRGFPKLRMLVVGDLMLDRYLIGSVARISPEAPVPVVKLARREDSLGGAANLANNVAALGAQVVLAGIVGEDEGGSKLAELAQNRNIDISAVVAADDRPTTVKTRIFAEHQQLLRIDEEETRPVGTDLSNLLIERVQQIFDKSSVDAILLSDYAKGVCTPSFCSALMALARERGIPVHVDPKGLDYEKYRGATSIKPNRAELLGLSAQQAWSDDLMESASRLRKELDLEFVAVTLGPQGILAVDRDGAMQAPAHSMQVYDVSGAGDTALAAVACALEAGLSLPEALALANLAAGEVVQRVGSVPIESGDLLVALHASGKSNEDRKVFELDDLADLRNAWRAKGLRVAFTNGCFDLIHAGHVGMLDAVAREADRLIVGLNSDDSIRRLKGDSRPLMPRDQRLAVISALESVDAVVVFEEDDPLNVIKALKPDVLAKGSDYEKANIVGAEFVEGYGGKVVRMPIEHRVSSSALAEALRKL